MSHLRDSRVTGPAARRDNVLAGKCKYPLPLPPTNPAQLHTKILTESYLRKS